MPTGDKICSGTWLSRRGTSCLPDNLKLWWDWTLAHSWTSVLCSSFYLHLQRTISVDKEQRQQKYNKESHHMWNIPVVEWMTVWSRSSVNLQITCIKHKIHKLWKTVILSALNQRQHREVYKRQLHIDKHYASTPLCQTSPDFNKIWQATVWQNTLQMSIMWTCV